MKYFVIFLILIGFSGITFAEQPISCTFGDKSTPLENIFEKDLAVKAFTEKHQNATQSIAANESDSLKNQLVIQAQNDNIKETLEIKFNTDTKGCYIPASYHYSYDDGIIDVTIRNSVANFTEIMNLIKSNNKSIDDFYPNDCDFVDLDVAITSGKVFGACKGTTSKFITILIDAPSNGVLEVDIPIQMVYSLPSTDCKPTGDFLVMSDNEETRYEIMPTDIGNMVKVEFAEGFHKIQIMGTVILPDPSPAQYCGIVEGYLDKKYLAPLDQTDNGVAFEFIRCNEGLVLIQKYDHTPACVKEFSIVKLMIIRWAKISPFDVTSGFFNHTIDNGQIISMKFVHDDCSPSIIVKINSEGQGNLVISIPRMFVNPSSEQEDDAFFVLVDGKEVNFEETVDSKQRTLEIQFSKETKEVEIAKACLI